VFITWFRRFRGREPQVDALLRAQGLAGADIRKPLPQR